MVKIMTVGSAGTTGIPELHPYIPAGAQTKERTERERKRERVRPFLYLDEQRETP